MVEAEGPDPRETILVFSEAWDVGSIEEGRYHHVKGRRSYLVRLGHTHHDLVGLLRLKLGRSRYESRWLQGGRRSTAGPQVKLSDNRERSTDSGFRAVERTLRVFGNAGAAPRTRRARLNGQTSSRPIDLTEFRIADPSAGIRNGSLHAGQRKESPRPAPERFRIYQNHILRVPGFRQRSGAFNSNAPGTVDTRISNPTPADAAKSRFGALQKARRRRDLPTASGMGGAASG